MARRIFYGKGKAQIELSGSMKAMVDRVLSRPGVRKVADRLEREAKKLHDQAAAEWPKKTGKSKAALTYGLRIPDPTHLEAFVGNTAPYWRYIRRPWPDNNKFIFRELVIKPGRRRTRKIARELGDELRRLAKG